MFSSCKQIISSWEMTFIKKPMNETYEFEWGLSNSKFSKESNDQHTLHLAQTARIDDETVFLGYVDYDLARKKQQENRSVAADSSCHPRRCRIGAPERLPAQCRQPPVC